MIVRRQMFIPGAALAIMIAAALFLFTWEKRQRLGNPGVRVIDVPMQGVDESSTATNTFFAGTNSIYLPENVLSYSSEPSPVARLVWDWLPKDTTYGQRIYRDTNGFQIQTLAVLMGKDRTSIHQPQYCVTGAGWQIVSQETTVVPISDPMPYELPVTRLKLRQTFRTRNGEEREAAAVLVYWFVADNQLTADHRQRMWWMARDLLRYGVLQRWAYVVELSLCRPGEEEATFARISEFIRASVPQFHLTPKPAGLSSRAASSGALVRLQPTLDAQNATLNPRAP